MKNLKKVSNIQEEETGSKEDIVNGNKRSPYLILDLQQYFYLGFLSRTQGEGRQLSLFRSITFIHSPTCRHLLKSLFSWDNYLVFSMTVYVISDCCSMTFRSSYLKEFCKIDIPRIFAKNTYPGVSFLKIWQTGAP